MRSLSLKIFQHVKHRQLTESVFQTAIYLLTLLVKYVSSEQFDRWLTDDPTMQKYYPINISDQSKQSTAASDILSLFIRCGELDGK